ncbi:MAG: hypothetical protein ACRDJW_21275 [Thermomicrobiales bacterium]
MLVSTDDEMTRAASPAVSPGQMRIAKDFEHLLRKNAVTPELLDILIINQEGIDDDT